MSESDTSVEACTRALVAFLERVAARASCNTVDRVAATDMTLSQLRMLMVLSRCDHDLSVNELADAVGLSLAAAGRGADRLVVLDLVTRREDECDRRVKRLSLSDHGREMIATQFRMRDDDLADLVAEIPGDVRGDLASALSSALEALPPTPSFADSSRT
ncbi:MarR family transcriptional regulator [Gordonia sihwensis]|uniref:MarR family winged helix-turn-helix transcriptional regulator n=1 Tax=Gordonia TaxID=2053 RepID=UPI001C92C5E2|nr:MarR family transcriptional regulator [Gordonia sihwensis]MBY4569354.1 MarR family transcriptional regulator [Gordonia sihwensis]WFN92263.1 MarR family transcriptional regulator [Gordonia sihwensis]